MKNKIKLKEKEIKALSEALYITNGTHYPLSEITKSFSLLSKKDRVKIEKYWSSIVNTFDKIDVILNETLDKHYYEKETYY